MLCHLHIATPELCLRYTHQLMGLQSRMRIYIVCAERVLRQQFTCLRMLMKLGTRFL